MNAPAKILLIDSDPPDRGILRNRMRDAGHSVVEIGDWKDGLEAVKQNSWDTIVVAFRCQGVLLGKLMPRLANEIPGRSLQALITYEARTESKPEDMGVALEAGIDAYVGREELPALVSIVNNRLAQCRRLRQLNETNSGLVHRQRVLREAPPGSAPTLNPGGVEAVMLADESGTVIASDAGAGKLVGQSPVGSAISQALPNLNAERLVSSTGPSPLVSEPFEQPGSYGANGAPLELNVFQLGSIDKKKTIKLALVTQNWALEKGNPVSYEHSCHIKRQGGLSLAARQKLGLVSFLGNNPVISGLRTTAMQAAQTEEPFLIIGAPGSGARTLAKAIHCTANPLAPLNQLQAGVLPSQWILEALAQAEAPQHARQKQTFLISQIDRMALEDQATLADLLGQGRVLLTSSKPPAALHPKLATALTNHFVVLPTLRERMDDLPLIANQFVDGLSRGSRIQFEAISALMQYPWPGNIAELESCVRSAHLAASVHTLAGEPVVISKEDLPKAILNYRFQSQGAARSGSTDLQPWQITDSDPISFDVYERKVILRALHHCKGNRLACARMLRLGKSTLYRKLKRLGIDEQE